jgi:hypothetical protein
VQYGEIHSIMLHMLTIILSNPLLIAVSILGIIVIVLLIITIMMNLKLRKFLIGIGGEHIGNSLDFAANNIKELQAFKSELESYLTTVENRLKKSVQSVHTVRFNPFKGEGGGGNQSFATAFLSEDGDGVIVSGLYSRDHVSIFSKPVKNHASEYELSGEEKEALEKAREKLN